MKTVDEITEQYMKHANRYYNLRSDDISMIADGATDLFMAIMYAFRFGYVKGRCAAISEMRKSNQGDNHSPHHKTGKVREIAE